MYVIKADITFSVGRKTLESRCSNLNRRRNVLEREIKRVFKKYKMVAIGRLAKTNLLILAS